MLNNDFGEVSIGRSYKESRRNFKIAYPQCGYASWLVYWFFPIVWTKWLRPHKAFARAAYGRRQTTHSISADRIAERETDLKNLQEKFEIWRDHVLKET